MKTKYTEIHNSLIKDLLHAKKQLIDKTRRQMYESLSIIPEEAKNIPLISLMMGLSKKYVGNSIVIKDNKAVVKNTKSKPKKIPSSRPSIVFQLENQSIILDGENIKGVTSKIGDRYLGMVEEINKVLKKHMK